MPCEESFLTDYYESLEIKGLLIRAFNLLNEYKPVEFHNLVEANRNNEKDLKGNILLIECFYSRKGESESDFSNRYDNMINETLELGNPISQYVIGENFDDDFNENQDKSKALYYFSLSSKQNFAPAMTNYGIKLIYGVSCPKDINKGLVLLEKADKLGDIIASEFLESYQRENS